MLKKKKALNRIVSELQGLAEHPQTVLALTWGWTSAYSLLVCLDEAHATLGQEKWPHYDTC